MNENVPVSGALCDGFGAREPITLKRLACTCGSHDFWVAPYYGDLRCRTCNKFYRAGGR